MPDAELDHAAHALSMHALSAGLGNFGNYRLSLDRPFPSGLYQALEDGDRRPSVVARELAVALERLAATWEAWEEVNLPAD